MVSSSKPREVGYISLKCAETNGTMAVKARRENFIVSDVGGLKRREVKFRN
jgi:hypothetical protein